MNLKPYTIPLGLLYLAGALQDAGHETLVYDMDFYQSDKMQAYSHRYRFENRNLVPDGFEDLTHECWREFTSVLQHFRPDITGISVMTSKFPGAITAAKIIKNHFPNAHITCGGPHPTVRPGEVLTHPEIDTCMLGESEESIVILADLLAGGQEVFAKVPGIAFRQQDRITVTPQPAYRKDLDAVAFPARDTLYHVDRYGGDLLGEIVTSRGCPYGCTFCGVELVMGKKYRMRSLENVLDEMALCMDRYGTRDFFFFDSIFTMRRQRVMAFCDMLLERRLDVSWRCGARMELLDEEMVVKMMDAGCRTISIGVESGDEFNLKRMAKHLSLHEIRRGARMLNGLGMDWHAFFIMGIPHETEAEVLRSVDFLHDLQPSSGGMSTFNPLPDTGLFLEMQKEGMLQEPMDWKCFSQESMNNYMDGLNDAEFEALVFRVADMFDEYNAGQYAKRLERLNASRPNPFAQRAIPSAKSILLIRSAPISLTRLALADLRDAYPRAILWLIAQEDVLGEFQTGSRVDRLIPFPSGTRFSDSGSRTHIEAHLPRQAFDICLILLSGDSLNHYENVQAFAAGIPARHRMAYTITRQIIDLQVPDLQTA